MMYNTFYNLLHATLETLYLTVVSTIFVAICGTLLGIVLFSTEKNQFLANKYIYFIISSIVNIIRAIPFFILIIILLPVTKILMGTILGPNAAFPALIIGISPLYARVVETSFKEINQGVIEAAKAHGASDLQVIFKVLLPESLPSLMANLVTITIAILGYSTMSGIIGAGGLGNLAYIEGFQRGNTLTTFYATLIILIIVFIIQFSGDKLVKKLDKRNC